MISIKIQNLCLRCFVIIARNSYFILQNRSYTMLFLALNKKCRENYDKFNN